jgi:glucokinase
VKYRDKGRLVLAGDIGGTKINLCIYSRGKTRPIPRVMESYSSSSAPDLETVIERFVERHSASFGGACLAVAGPVIDGRSKLTNLPWEVSETRIKRRFGWTTRIINDLASTGLAIPILHNRELHPLNPVRPRKGHNIAIIAPGTGLGTSILAYYEGIYVPIASEGGHVDFAPADENQVLLWGYLRQRYGHVSVERIVSGMGILNIFYCLKEARDYRVPEWLGREIEEKDPAQAIAEAAVNSQEPLCVEVFRVFSSILGAVAGNLALTVLATGGVYLAGGIPPKILPALLEGAFIKAFSDKGRFKGLLEKIAVRVILNDKAALLGAARCALEGDLEMV